MAGRGVSDIPRLWLACLHAVLFPLHCLASPCVVLFPLCCLASLVLCVLCVVFHCGRLSFSLPLFRLCVCRHSVVGLGLCLCGRGVSLWNSGDGLCGAEGRVVSTVYCQLFMCCGVCFSVVCVVLLCCVVGCGMAGV